MYHQYTVGDNSSLVCWSRDGVNRSHAKQGDGSDGRPKGFDEVQPHQSRDGNHDGGSPSVTVECEYIF